MQKLWVVFKLIAVTKRYNYYSEDYYQLDWVASFDSNEKAEEFLESTDWDGRYIIQIVYQP